MLFLPILGPAFGLTSAIEGLTLQGKKMNRHFDGVDFTIIIAGGNKPDRTTLLQTYCACPVRISHFSFQPTPPLSLTHASQQPKSEQPLIYSKKVTVKLVSCRLTLIE